MAGDDWSDQGHLRLTLISLKGLINRNYELAFESFGFEFIGQFVGVGV